MPKRAAGKRRQIAQISPSRAARLFKLLGLMGESPPKSRDVLMQNLGIGLRTYYRELQLLKRCGIRVSLSDKTYRLHASLEHAQGRLPFPDPRLNFAEAQELVEGSGPASRRILDLLNKVMGKAR